nr:MAG TPA: hypothetical protein [Caudoviricetes sp.]
MRNLVIIILHKVTNLVTSCNFVYLWELEHYKHL